MNKICTSLEQSEKLIELGIDVSTADMFWWHNTEEKRYEAWLIDYAFISDMDIPAWSLSALLGLMPTFTLNGYGNGQFNCRDERANKYALVDTCPLDAAFEMVAWLLENNKL